MLIADLSSEKGSCEYDMAKTSIFVSKVGYMEVSEKRYCVLGGVVAGRTAGTCRGSSGSRLAIFLKSGSCCAWSGGSSILEVCKALYYERFDE